MTTPFDIRTEQLAVDHHKKVNPYLANDPYYERPEKNQTITAYIEGRNSARESLEILARAVEKVLKKNPGAVNRFEAADMAVEFHMALHNAFFDVRNRNDWPLPKETP